MTDAVTEVLVVGAGPVGLLTALELSHLGVRVRVVDRAEGPSTRSKATTLWPRQLELLDRVGVAGQLVARGHRIDRVLFHGGSHVLGSANLGALDRTPYPFGVSVPQPVTEEVLGAALAARGVQVERGLEVVAVEQPGGDTVRSVLVDRGGRAHDVESSWVVACDGAHSTVRGLLEIPFDDDNPPVTFAITDVEIDGDVPTGTLGYHFSPAGALGLVPLGGRTFRIAIGVPADTDPEPPRAMFQGALDRRTPYDARLGSMTWSATFTVRFRTASRFREGRVLLAGDSAHIMSPAGGQGMNTGIQDAVAVAWRIAADLHAGGAPRHVLDYSPERHLDVRRVAQLTKALTRVGLVRTRRERVVRDVLAATARTLGLLDTRLAPRIAQLDTRYGNHPRRHGRTLAVGDRVPGAFGPAGARSFPVLATTTCTTLVWPGRRSAPAATRWADAVTRRLRTEAGGSVVLLDPRTVPAALRRTLPRHRAVLVVLPDGHVRWVGDDPVHAVRAVVPMARTVRAVDELLTERVPS